MEHVYCVIMAGGKGERFWPLSGKTLPKPFIKLIGNKTLFQMTVERALGLVPENHILVVLGKEHLEVAQEQLAHFNEDQFIVEPVGRDTAPCIGYSASILTRRDPRALMIMLPADHYIPDSDAFVETLSVAARRAQRGDYLVTVGIRPTRPDTGYGYVYAQEAVKTDNGDQCYRVNRFVEKPSEEKALEYLAEGNYYWNSGMFIWKAEVVLKGMARHMSGLYDGLKAMGPALDKGDQDSVEALFVGLPRISIDYGLMEKADNVLMVKADFRWDDVGTWSSLRRVMDLDGHGNCLRGKPVCVDTKNCVIYGDNVKIGTIGVSDLIIVASRGGVLVCDMNRDQDTRQIARLVEEETEG
jgi:mannose-1-phosphate guanylyltransferase